MNHRDDLQRRISSAIYAGILGDALGVPVEHSTRHELSLVAVKNMLGFGRYDQPAGTWSDDTSLVLCTMESLLRGYDPDDMARTFCRWMFESYWTATGFVFDAGVTTFLALERFRSGTISARECGGTTEDDCGNGALMRMLPAAVYFRNEPAEKLLERIHDVAAITHAHPRSLIACGLYSLIIAELCRGVPKEQAFGGAVETARAYYKGDRFAGELPHFRRILSGESAGLDRSHISSSGYVVDTLEASLWCFLRHTSTREILLSAVNLGLDTDTTGMVAGGLAGACYGLEGIPGEWPASLARKEEIDGLVDSFVRGVTQ